jgi:hypothetical protein
MTYMIGYWDAEASEQRERAMTAEETADFQARLAGQEKLLMDDYLAEVRSLRERILIRLGGIATAAIATSDQATIDAYLLARQRLLDITKLPAAVAATTKADLETAIKAEYLDIVASVTASLKTAFDQVDQ